MALPDLTGQNIQDTYQRVLQTDNGTLKDGTGSAVTLTNFSASGNMFISGAILPAVGDNVTSSFSLGSATNVWKDLFVSEESLKFVSSSGTITSLKQSEVRLLKEGKSIRTTTKDLKGDDGSSRDIIVTRGIISAIADDTLIKFGNDIMGCVLSGSMFFEIHKNDSNNRVTMGNGTTDLQLRGNINEATLDGGTF